MPIPQFRTLMQPLLELLGDHKSHTTRELIGNLGKEFGLTEKEKTELLPSGEKLVFESRVERTLAAFSDVGLVYWDEKSGTWTITKAGLLVLIEAPTTFDYLFGRSRDKEGKKGGEEWEEEEEEQEGRVSLLRLKQMQRH